MVPPLTAPGALGGPKLYAAPPAVDTLASRFPEYARPPPSSPPVAKKMAPSETEPITL